MMRVRRAGFVACLGLAALVGERGACAADPPDARREAAEALFEQGRELLDLGRYATACQRFEASQKLDPGLGTLLFLGECYDKLGKSASAWRAFSEAARLASRKSDEERGRLARIRASALEPAVPQLRVRVAPETRALPSVEYTLNGLELPARDLEQPLRVDPGRALLRVTAPGHQRWETEIGILEGGSFAVVDVPELAPERSARAGPNAWDGFASPGLEQHPGSGRAPGELEPRSNGLRTAGWIVVTVGLAGVGAGVYFGLRAVHEAERSKSVSHCPLPDRCYADGLELRDDARNHAHLSDLGIGIGASLVVGGSLLVLLAPDPAAAQGSARGWSIRGVEGGAAANWEGRW
jgi:hypothetical protein